MPLYVKKLTKNGQILLPAALYRMLGIKDGEFVTIYEDANQLVVTNHHENAHLNKCIFRNGKLSIPMELRKMLKIDTNTLLLLQAYPENGFIKIMKLIEDQANSLHLEI